MDLDFLFESGAPITKCPLCGGSPEAFQINLKTAVILCKNVKCMYPLGLNPLVYISRNAFEDDFVDPPAFDVLGDGFKILSEDDGAICVKDYFGCAENEIICEENSNLNTEINENAESKLQSCTTAKLPQIDTSIVIPEVTHSPIPDLKPVNKVEIKPEALKITNPELCRNLKALMKYKNRNVSSNIPSNVNLAPLNDTAVDNNFQVEIVSDENTSLRVIVTANADMK